MNVKMKKAGLVTATLASASLATLPTAALANQALNDLGGRVISTTDTVISEIGGAPGAAYEDTIIEETHYVTAPVENYLPPAPVYNEPAPAAPAYQAPAPAYQAPTYASNDGYVQEYYAPEQYVDPNTGYADQVSAQPATTYYAPSLANTGAAVIGIGIAAVIALVSGLSLAFWRKNKNTD